MKKRIVVIIILVLVLLASVLILNHFRSGSNQILTNTEQSQLSTDEITGLTSESAVVTTVKSGDIFTVKVNMDDSGLIKAMALSLQFNEDDFELVDGQWLNHKAEISDFNLENRDAAIAFMEARNYYGEIFEFRLKAKKDVSVNLDDIRVNPILKNGVDDVACKGIILSID